SCRARRQFVIAAQAGMMPFRRDGDCRYSLPMRPERLNPLFAETAGLKGVGPQLAKPLEKLGLTRIRDLAYHLPDRFVERRAVANLDEATVGENIVVALTPA